MFVGCAVLTAKKDPDSALIGHGAAYVASFGTACALGARLMRPRERVFFPTGLLTSLAVVSAFYHCFKVAEWMHYSSFVGAPSAASEQRLAPRVINA